MRVRRIDIRNFRAIRERGLDVPPRGLMACGTNGVGKSSFVEAFVAALRGTDVKIDAVTIGEEEGEVRLELDDGGKIRRRLPSGDVIVTTADGAKRAKPQSFLNELVGPLLDPLALADAAPKERKALVLRAIPATVSVEDLRRYAPDLPAGFDAGGHALEAIERARKLYYDRRADANAVAKGFRADAARAEENAKTKSAAAPVGAPTTPEAERDLAAAARALAALDAQDAQARTAAERTQGTRARVEQLRAEAAAERASAITADPAELDEEKNRTSLAEDRVFVLEREIQEARAAARAQRERYEALRASDTKGRQRITRANDLERQAADLEAGIAAAVAQPVAPADRAAATAAMTLAGERRVAARLRAEAEAANAAAEALARSREEADAKAAALDKIVRALEDAPKALLARAGDGFEAISLEDEDVWLDGVRLSKLCGYERLTFCVDVAKRLAGKLKLFAIDGLEAVAEDQLQAFLEHAVAGGFTVIASRTEAGALRHVAILPDAAPTSEAAA